MTIQETKAYFMSLPMKGIPGAIEKLQADPRAGIQTICKQYERKYKLYEKDKSRMDKFKEFDQVFANNGQYILVGIDEAGRGPLAGPVVAAAVILPADIDIVEINDSKKINEDNRERLYDEIMEKAISVGVGIVEADVIDEINILQATFEAMRIAVADLNVVPEVLLVDGNQTIPKLANDMTQHAVTKGDAKSISVAAASIIAKVTRDRMMKEYHEIYPDYLFRSNKGYGSVLHQRALQEIGPCPIHRTSFIKKILSYVK